MIASGEKRTTRLEQRFFEGGKALEPKIDK
jgi:hypothetical protein